ncbi:MULTISPECIES: RluA family pseudouridine synthase [unclassified Jeotgalibaca]|uniref:RluA family pseudouridine synthase n=1 Tax=unclassified Jeotgalibaca TaxID=2621505 RepID=UPI003FD64DE2
MIFIKTGVTDYTITESTTLLPFLIAIHPNLGRNAVKSILTRGQVAVDGKKVTQHNHPLAVGQTVSVMSNKTAMTKTALKGINILHEDDAIIVIHKDAGILSMGDRNQAEMTAYRQLTQYVKETNKNSRIFIVHRLDRDTSGVMVYAKTEEVKEALQKDWHTIVKERIYTALVEGEVTESEGTIKSWLTESKAMKVHSYNYDNGGKYAVTHWKKIRGNKEHTLLEVELETGRKNQIRVHMESIGHPVAGDKKYGAKRNPLKRLGLHASTLAFIHPKTGKLERYTSKVPKDFLFYSKES